MCGVFLLLFFSMHDIYTDEAKGQSTNQSYSFSLPRSGCSMWLSSMLDRPTVSSEDSQCIPLLDCDGD